MSATHVNVVNRYNKLLHQIITVLFIFQVCAVACLHLVVTDHQAADHAALQKCVWHCSMLLFLLIVK